MPYNAPPSISPVTGASLADKAFYIHSDASTGFFRDTHGRTLLLRGINLASSAKTPQGQPGQQLQGFWEGAESGDVSFVNRVLDLSPDAEHTADEHLQRLRSWGFNTIRYVTTWESIEHSGPGQYDEEYIQYTIRMLRKCMQHGFLVFMDPHQDLWSRFSGGSGAPYWTLLACGLNPRNFMVTNAAVIQCEWPDPKAPSPKDFPDMIWASNYTRLAVMTLMTLFFAGKHYAPRCIINGVNIQDYLQSHFLAAFRHLGEAIKNAGDLYDICVIGWDSMNEPNHGLLGLEDITVLPSAVRLRIGPMPTAFHAMKLGMGEAVEVEKWKFGPLGSKKEGKIRIDPQGARAWLDPSADMAASAKYGWKRSEKWPAGECIWALHGVWEPQSGQVLKKDYFSARKGEIDFGRDFWRPHWLRWAKMVREVHPEAIHFIHPPVFEVPPDLNTEDCQQVIKGRAALSSHFYDGLTLITKHWNWFNADAVGLLRGKYPGVPFAVRVGESAIRKCMRDQLGYLRQDVLDCMGNYPSMMGEIGIPYDLDKGKAYESGDYKNQSQAMDASLNACDGKNLFNYTLWTYNPENTHTWGENWNGEDLSVWSLDDMKQMPPSILSKMYDQESENASSEELLSDDPLSKKDTVDLDSGARAIEAFVRPYPTHIAGIPISIDFDTKTSKLTLVVEIRPGLLTPGSETLPTVIYLPRVHYGNVSPMQQQKREDRIDESEGLSVRVSSGTYQICGRTLEWQHEHHTQATRETIEIIASHRTVQGFWSRSGCIIA